MVASRTRSFGAVGYDASIIKIDSNGNTLWSRNYGGNNTDAVESVKQTTDGGYIVAGYTTSFGAGEGDSYVIKVDPFGDTLWTRIYGGSSFDDANSVQQTTDGGYIVAGYTESFGAGAQDVMLTKLNSSGNTCIGEFVPSTVVSVTPSVTSPATVVTLPPASINRPPTIVCPEEEIPTMSQWGLIILVGLIVASTVFIFRRKTRTIRT